MLDFKILSPSYKRANLARTHLLIPELKYVIRESQADEYRAANLPIEVVPDSMDGNVAKIRNTILELYGKYILMLDDDMDKIGMWTGHTRSDLEYPQIMQMIDNGFQMACDMGVKLWGINCLQDKFSYREYTPFSFSAFIGGPLQGHCGNDLRYDEKIPLKEDYDHFIQQMAKYRRVLRINRFHYYCKMHEIAGGCSTYRTIEGEKRYLANLQKKWGSRIVKTDCNNRMVRRDKELDFDINPIINIPIKGI